MEKTLFTRGESARAMKAPAARNMTQISKLNYNNKNSYLNSTIHLLFKFKNIWRTSRVSSCRNNSSKHIPANSQCNIMCRYSRHEMSFFALTKQHLWLMFFMLLMTLIHHVQSVDVTRNTNNTKRVEASTTKRYSQLLSTSGLISMHDDVKNLNDDDDTFRPFVPKDPEQISRNVFTPSGQFRVFQPIDTDLRVGVSTKHKSKMSKLLNTSLNQTNTTPQMNRNQKKSKEIVKAHEKETMQAKQTNSKHFLHTKQQQQQHIEHHDLEVKHKLKHQTPYQHTPEQHNKQHPTNVNDDATSNEQNEISKWHDLTSDLKSLDDLLLEYVANYFEKGLYEPTHRAFVFELQKNHSETLPNEMANRTRTERQTADMDAQDRIDLPRTLQTGRLLFLTGLKKVLWPVFMGLQILKSLLIAMFIPALIGSFTKLLGKGISTGSAPLFIRPMEPPQELDFRDTNLAFEEDNNFLTTNDGIKVNGPYNYNNQQDTAQMHNEYVFDPAASNNPLSYTRLGMNERQHQLMQDSYMNALQSIGSASFKNSGSLSTGSSGLVAPMAKRPPPAANVNTFQQFQKVPDSSLLLSNYDPFYSPLLSRLDSVFAQLKINSDKEICREKLICLMYANPAKYAPYSNLVSAQLSRELNELRKPTSDNPDILRFFKYMRAAKDGQDGVDCEKTFDICTEFKDFENPAMVSTYHDINKLVQARKFNSK